MERFGWWGKQKMMELAMLTEIPSMALGTTEES
jgi:hypothetical protein